jgi:hypothetical protein
MCCVFVLIHKMKLSDKKYSTCLNLLLSIIASSDEAQKNGFEKIRWSICTDTPPPDTPTQLFLFLGVRVII